MLDPIVAFFTRVFQWIGRGIGFLIGILLWPVMWFGRWYLQKGEGPGESCLLRGDLGVAGRCGALPFHGAALSLERVRHPG